MVHRGTAYIARIGEISIRMLQCNKTQRAAKPIVHLILRMSENSV